MAHQLGFFVIQMGIQFAGDVNAKALDEVRNELHMTDLRTGFGPSLRVRDRVANTLPTRATGIADQWATTVDNQIMTAAIKHAYTNRKRERVRLQAIDGLRAANQLSGNRGGW